jgi:hypothetical protein
MLYFPDFRELLQMLICRPTYVLYALLVDLLPTSAKPLEIWLRPDVNFWR